MDNTMGQQYFTSTMGGYYYIQSYERVVLGLKLWEDDTIASNMGGQYYYWYNGMVLLWEDKTIASNIRKQYDDQYYGRIILLPVIWESSIMTSTMGE